MWKIISFLLITTIFTYISRASLRAPRSHGFYRFFAWEFMLVLFLLNEKFWFQNPFAWYQLISWTAAYRVSDPTGIRSQCAKVTREANCEPRERSVIACI